MLNLFVREFIDSECWSSLSNTSISYCSIWASFWFNEYFKFFRFSCLLLIIVFISLFIFSFSIVKFSINKFFTFTDFSWSLISAVYSIHDDLNWDNSSISCESSVYNSVIVDFVIFSGQTASLYLFYLCFVFEFDRLLYELLLLLLADWFETCLTSELAIVESSDMSLPIMEFSFSLLLSLTQSWNTSLFLVIESV